MAKKQNNTLNELGVKERINLSCLELNEGQIVGIPKNPRYLKGEEHDKLKKSLKSSPELLQYKPLMVYAIEGGKFVVICGNMRLRICQELHNEGAEGFDALPCFVLNKDVPIAKIKEYAIKDNVQAGNWDWDELANGDWEVDDLQDWGVNCSFLQHDDAENLDGFFEEVESGEAKKEKKIEIKVSIPEEEEDTKDIIKQLIEDALVEYPNVKVE
ncbi:MAG: ParB-like nuclease domain [Bacteriophage sp.]|nr:MAG: ParB-like nuclease domain [Bacteriophage sp.]